MRESLVNMENSRTFADATKTVVSHSVRANGNRSRHQVVSLFYRPSVSRTPRGMSPNGCRPERFMCSSGYCCLCSNWTCSRSFVKSAGKKGYYAAGRDLERQDRSHRDQSPCVALPRIIHQLNIQDYDTERIYPSGYD